MAQGAEQTAERLAKVTERLEQLTRRQRSGPLGAFKPFLLGALAGAGAALLYAPQAGEQSRELLRRNATDLQERATQGAQIAKGKIQERNGAAQESVQKALTQVSDHVEATADTARTQLRSATQEAKQTIAEGGEAAQEAANAATDKAAAQSEEQVRKAGRPNPKVV